MAEISQPNFKSYKISKNQTTKDILKGISKAINDSKETSKILAEKFRSKDPVKSCEKVWHYLKDNLEYIREGENDQTSKTLPRLIYDKYGDCKHYTIFSYAILDALNIPVFMRLVSQKILNKEPTHIYTYALINGKEYIVDPVMNDFNQECKHNYKCDLTLNKAMSMTHLSGTDENASLGRKKNNFFSRTKDKLSDAEKKRKSAFKEVKKKHDAFVKKQGKKIQTGVKKYAHIRRDVAVKQFLFFVSKNGLNLANRIKAVYKTHPEDLKKFWANYGSWQDLTTAVNKGTKLGASMSGMGEDAGGDSQYKQYEEGAKQSMGIIQQILEFFKKRKEKKSDAQEQADSEALKSMESSVMSDPNIPKVDENGNPATATTDANESKDGQKEETDYTMPLILTGSAVGLYLLTKK